MRCFATTSGGRANWWRSRRSPLGALKVDEATYAADLRELRAAARQRQRCKCGGRLAARKQRLGLCRAHGGSARAVRNSEPAPFGADAVEFAAAAAQVRPRPQRAVYLEAHGFRVQGTALPPEATLRRAALRQACKGTLESLQLLAAFDSSNHTDLPLREQGRRATNVTPRRRLSWRTRARRRRCGARCDTVAAARWRQRDCGMSSLAGCGRGACPRMPCSRTRTLWPAATASASGRRALGAVRHVVGTGLAGGRGGNQPDARQRGARRGQLF